jgi:hypothetical protein
MPKKITRAPSRRAKPKTKRNTANKRLKKYRSSFLVVANTG